jgi:hypothetical protein
MLDKTDIQNAIDKKYTAFSAAVQQDLKSKLRDHSATKKYVSDFDEIQRMKSIFSQINTSQE